MSMLLTEEEQGVSVLRRLPALLLQTPPVGIQSMGISEMLSADGGTGWGSPASHICSPGWLGVWVCVSLWEVYYHTVDSISCIASLQAADGEGVICPRSTATEPDGTSVCNLVA